MKTTADGCDCFVDVQSKNKTLCLLQMTVQMWRTRVHSSCSSVNSSGHLLKHHIHRHHHPAQPLSAWWSCADLILSSWWSSLCSVCATAAFFMASSLSASLSRLSDLLDARRVKARSHRRHRTELSLLLPSSGITSRQPTLYWLATATTNWVARNNLCVYTVIFAFHLKISSTSHFTTL